MHGTFFSPLKGKESDHTIDTIPCVDNRFWYFQKTLSSLKDSLSNRVEFRYKLATCTEQLYYSWLISFSYITMALWQLLPPICNFVPFMCFFNSNNGLPIDLNLKHEHCLYIIHCSGYQRSRSCTQCGYNKITTRSIQKLFLEPSVYKLKNSHAWGTNVLSDLNYT